MLSRSSLFNDIARTRQGCMTVARCDDVMSQPYIKIPSGIDPNNYSAYIYNDKYYYQTQTTNIGLFTFGQ